MERLEEIINNIILSKSESEISQSIETEINFINENDQNGTILETCLKKLYGKLALFLVQNQKNLIIKDQDGAVSLLHLAIINKDIIIADFLINKGLSIKAQDYNSKTVLHHYAESDFRNNLKQDLAILQFLLKKAALLGEEEYKKYINIKDNYNKTALHYAVTLDKEIVEYLINEGAEDLPDNDGKIPLHYVSAKCTDKRVIEFLLGKAKNKEEYINIRDNDGKTPLHYAVESNDKQIVEYLLDQGARLDSPDNNGKTPLHYAVNTINAINKEIIELLLKNAKNKKEYIDKRDKDGKTALHYAASSYFFLAHPKIESMNMELFIIVKYLINQGAEVNLSDNNGKSSLHYAAIQGAKEIIEHLIDHGAELDSPDNDGKTPLHYAMERFFPEKQQIRKEGITELLLRKAKNKKEYINKRDKNGKTALYYALERGLIETAAYLTYQGAEIDILLDYKDKTLLHSLSDYNSIRRDKETITEFLLKRVKNKKLYINLKDKDGKTALYYAVDSGDKKLTEYLISQGAELGLDNNGEENLLHYQIMIGHERIVEFLIEKAENKKEYIGQRDKYGRTALHIAVCSPAIIKILINHDADVNLLDNGGKTPLHYITKSVYTRSQTIRHEEIIELLLRRAENKREYINKTDKDGNTALCYVVYSGNIELTEYLISQGAELDLDNGETILHRLVKKRNGLPVNIELTKILIKNGADPEKKDKNKKSFLSYLKEDQRSEIEKYIKEIKVSDPKVKKDENSKNKNILIIRLIAIITIIVSIISYLKFDFIKDIFSKFNNIPSESKPKNEISHGFAQALNKSREQFKLKK